MYRAKTSDSAGWCSSGWKASQLVSAGRAVWVCALGSHPVSQSVHWKEVEKLLISRRMPSSYIVSFSSSGVHAITFFCPILCRSVCLFRFFTRMEGENGEGHSVNEKEYCVESRGSTIKPLSGRLSVKDSFILLLLFLLLHLTPTR